VRVDIQRESKPIYRFYLSLHPFFVQPAVAAEYVSDDWQFTLIPYLWALSGSGDNEFAGDIDLKGPTIGLAYHF